MVNVYLSYVEAQEASTGVEGIEGSTKCGYSNVPGDGMVR